MKSGVEKRPSRFSFIRAEAFIPHPFGCNKRYESRLQFLMRTRSATFTACCVIGDARKSCAGNFALRARCKSRTARICSDKSEGEKRLTRFSFIKTLAISPHCSKSLALAVSPKKAYTPLYAECTERCRVFFDCSFCFYFVFRVRKTADAARADYERGCARCA